MQKYGRAAGSAFSIDNDYRSIEASRGKDLHNGLKILSSGIGLYRYEPVYCIVCRVFDLDRTQFVAFIVIGSEHRPSVVIIISKVRKAVQMVDLAVAVAYDAAVEHLGRLLIRL